MERPLGYEGSAQEIRVTASVCLTHLLLESDEWSRAAQLHPLAIEFVERFMEVSVSEGGRRPGQTIDGSDDHVPGRLQAIDLQAVGDEAQIVATHGDQPAVDVRPSVEQVAKPGGSLRTVLTSDVEHGYPRDLGVVGVHEAEEGIVVALESRLRYLRGDPGGGVAMRAGPLPGGRLRLRFGQRHAAEFVETRQRSVIGIQIVGVGMCEPPGLPDPQVPLPPLSAARRVEVESREGDPVGDRRDVGKDGGGHAAIAIQGAHRLDEVIGRTSIDDPQPAVIDGLEIIRE